MLTRKLIVQLSTSAFAPPRPNTPAGRERRFNIALLLMISGCTSRRALAFHQRGHSRPHCGTRHVPRGGAAGAGAATVTPVQKNQKKRRSEKSTLWSLLTSVFGNAKLPPHGTRHAPCRRSARVRRSTLTPRSSPRPPPPAARPPPAATAGQERPHTLQQRALATTCLLDPAHSLSPHSVDTVAASQ